MTRTPPCCCDPYGVGEYALVVTHTRKYMAPDYTPGWLVKEPTRHYFFTQTTGALTGICSNAQPQGFTTFGPGVKACCAETPTHPTCTGNGKYVERHWYNFESTDWEWTAPVYLGSFEDTTPEVKTNPVVPGGPINSFLPSGTEIIQNTNISFSVFLPEAYKDYEVDVPEATPNFLEILDGGKNISCYPEQDAPTYLSQVSTGSNILTHKNFGGIHSRLYTTMYNHLYLRTAVISNMAYTDLKGYRNYNIKLQTGVNEERIQTCCDSATSCCLNVWDPETKEFTNDCKIVDSLKVKQKVNTKLNTYFTKGMGLVNKKLNQPPFGSVPGPLTSKIAGALFQAFDSTSVASIVAGLNAVPFTVLEPIYDIDYQKEKICHKPQFNIILKDTEYCSSDAGGHPEACWSLCQCDAEYRKNYDLWNMWFYNLTRKWYNVNSPIPYTGSSEIKITVARICKSTYVTSTGEQKNKIFLVQEYPVTDIANKNDNWLGPGATAEHVLSSPVLAGTTTEYVRSSCGGGEGTPLFKFCRKTSYYEFTHTGCPIRNEPPGAVKGSQIKDEGPYELTFDCSSLNYQSPEPHTWEECCVNCSGDDVGAPCDDPDCCGGCQTWYYNYTVNAVDGPIEFFTGFGTCVNDHVCEHIHVEDGKGGWFPWGWWDEDFNLCADDMYPICQGCGTPYSVPDPYYTQSTEYYKSLKDKRIQQFYIPNKNALYASTLLGVTSPVLNGYDNNKSFVHQYIKKTVSNNYPAATKIMISDTFTDCVFDADNNPKPVTNIEYAKYGVLYSDGTWQYITPFYYLNGFSDRVYRSSYWSKQRYWRYMEQYAKDVYKCSQGISGGVSGGCNSFTTPTCGGISGISGDIKQKYQEYCNDLVNYYGITYPPGLSGEEEQEANAQLDLNEFVKYPIYDIPFKPLNKWNCESGDCPPTSVGDICFPPYLFEGSVEYFTGIKTLNGIS